MALKRRQRLTVVYHAPARQDYAERDTVAGFHPTVCPSVCPNPYLYVCLKCKQVFRNHKPCHLSNVYFIRQVY